MIRTCEDDILYHHSASSQGKVYETAVGKQSTGGPLYMDGLGDPGRSPASQPTYAVCTVWVSQSEEELEMIFAAIRRSLGLRVNYEFHANQLTSRDWHADMPKSFFEALASEGVSVECWCAEVEKKKTKLPIEIAGKVLTHELMAQTLLRMPPTRSAGQTLIIDEEAKGKKVPKVIQDMRAGIKSALAKSGQTPALAKISARPAHLKAGLQLADFLAAALVNPWPSCRKSLEKWSIDHWKA